MSIYPLKTAPPEIPVSANLRQMNFLQKKSFATNCHSKSYLCICGKFG